MSLATRLHHLLLCMAMISTAPASAGISLDSTRIIFDAKNNKSGVNIQVTSAQNSETPYLVKTQVTQDMSGKEGNVPFITTPSLFRLDPGNSNQVRIMAKPYAFPEDRESIFYFRAVAIPTQAKNEDGNISRVSGDLQLASGNIIKLFYRPAGLTILPEKSADKLIFSSVNNGIKVSNPTPYFVTLTSLNINGQEVNLRTTPGSNMIPPKSEAVFSTPHRQGKVQWQVINDYGGMEKFNGTVQ